MLYLTDHGDRLFKDRHTLGDGEAFLEKPFTVAGLLEAVSLQMFGRLAPLAGPGVGNS